MIDLLQFRKPQRYIGNEFNVIKKPHSGKITFCLGFPDLYEIGMSNLGMHIIYGLLNQDPEIVCERVFMPGLDLTQYLSKTGIKLFSLESKTTIDKFEIIGFNLGHELNYTNFLKMLELGRLPLYSKDRINTIVIAGGVANPEPIADFVDVFYLGEFEETAQLFINVIKKYKNKQERLRALAELDGFYIPAYYNIEVIHNKYKIQKIYPYAQLSLKRQHLKDLDRAFVPFKWLTPHTEITHDRIPVEIARGCPHRCAFCQARSIYFPYREKKIETVKRIIEQTYKYSGYENISLLSLSASDHSKIEELIETVSPFLEERRIGLNLPSLRVGDIIGLLQKKLTRLKKTSLTVAIEAARDNLRKSMNKYIDTTQLFEAVKILRSLGTRRIKLYFMFGFAEEIDDDLIAIGEFLNKLHKIGKISINVSINVFIPKPFSFWQDFSMHKEELIYQKRRRILQNIPRNRNIKVSFSDPKKSILEAILSRGDRKLSQVLQRAVESGALFDSYGEINTWDIWEKVFAERKIDYNSLLSISTENFPWSHIN